MTNIPWQLSLLHWRHWSPFLSLTQQRRRGRDHPAHLALPRCPPATRTRCQQVLQNSSPPSKLFHSQPLRAQVPWACEFFQRSAVEQSPHSGTPNTRFLWLILSIAAELRPLLRPSVGPALWACDCRKVARFGGSFLLQNSFNFCILSLPLWTNA